ncbi:MAG: hypothetical protein WC732_09840 [Candidatus Omnitrophota bacterium]
MGTEKRTIDADLAKLRWYVPRVYAWFLMVLLAHVLWSLTVQGGPFLIYLSNWLYIANALFYIAVVAGESIPQMQRVAVFACYPLLSCDILWTVYSIGLAIYGASCFGNTQQSTFFYYVFSFCQAYGHVSPLLLVCLFAIAFFEHAAAEWARVFDVLIMRSSAPVAALTGFAIAVAWYVVPALPCLVYSYVMDPLVVYGISVTFVQLTIILVVSFMTEVVVGSIALWHILIHHSRLRTK